MCDIDEHGLPTSYICLEFAYGFILVEGAYTSFILASIVANVALEN